MFAWPQATLTGVRGAVRRVSLRRRRHDHLRGLLRTQGGRAVRPGRSSRACWPSSSASWCSSGRTRSARCSCTSSRSGRSWPAIAGIAAGLRLRQDARLRVGLVPGLGRAGRTLRYRPARQSGGRDPEHPVAGRDLGDHEPASCSSSPASSSARWATRSSTTRRTDPLYRRSTDFPSAFAGLSLRHASRCAGTSGVLVSESPPKRSSS